jgi:4-alpha-glucanotransferase
VEYRTAENGRWVPVRGRELLEVLVEHFGALPLIAEDLGMISPEVTQMRQDFNLPGMVILQFAFDSDADNPYLPHNHKPVSVVYTGTHDNNTLKGWFDGLDQTQRNKVCEYLGMNEVSMPWPMIRMALDSVCNLAIVPMQDLLELDARHRMNTPGKSEGNWHWRFEWDWVQESLARKLKYLNELYGR